jgi:signal transduction histidine kinase
MMLTEFNRSLMLIVDRNLLVTNIVSKIRQISPVERIIIFLLNVETEKYVLAGKRQPQDEAFRNMQFTPHSKLTNWLSVNERCFRVSGSDEVMTYLSDRERELLCSEDIELIFPMKVMNRLNGFVMLGARADGKDFTRQDIDILSLLFDQAAFALENTALYEEQSARIKKMYRADRLAILGQLAAGAAHEIRNPLTAIRSSIQYLGKGVNDPDRMEMFGGLLDEVDRINKIVQGLLSFARPSELETAHVDIAQLLRQTLTLLHNVIDREGIEVSLDVSIGNTVITADATQLKQVFLNVILNAVEAMENSAVKQLTLGIANGRTLDYLSRYLLVSVADTGKGIEQNDLENIFNPFYTTKTDGTGLGLPISYGIVNRHGGEMEVNSSPGKGATVVIKLPQVM